MLINNNVNINHWQRDFDLNLYESRLAFFAAKKEQIETERRYFHGINIIDNLIENDQKEIDELNREIDDLTRRSRLGGILKGKEKFDDQITKLIAKRDAIIVRKESREKVRNDLNKPITSRVEFDSTLKDINSYSNTLASLEGPVLDQVSIDMLCTSDLGVFFREELTTALEHSQNKMVMRDKIYNLTLTKSADPKISGQANADWMVHEKEITEKIKKEKKKQVVDLHEINMHNKERSNRINWINRRIAELESIEKAKKEAAESKSIEGADENYNALLKKQIEEDLRGVSGRIHKDVMVNQERNVVKVSNLLSKQNKDQLRDLLLLAREMNEAQVMKYLEGRYNIIAEKFKALKDKKPPHFSDIQAQDIKRFLKGFLSTVINNPEALRHGRETVLKIAENLEHTENVLDNLDSELSILDKKAKNPEAFKNEAHRKHILVKSKIQELTPERIDRILIALDNEERARLQSLKPNEKTKYDRELGASLIYKKRKAAYEDLKRADHPLRQSFQEADIQIQNIEKLSQEEVVGLNDDLNYIYEKLLFYTGEKVDKALDKSKWNNTDKARAVIRLIAGESNPEKIMVILKDNLGPEHLELVNDSEFENHLGSDGKRVNLKEVTSGAMVFYERGEEWKIIINKDGIKNVEDLTNQITHELRHLEFENDKETKEDMERIFMQNPKWTEIKQSFLNTFPDKIPPVGDEWKDEYVLSELYAMLHEIFGESEKLKNLRKVIEEDAKISPKDIGIPEAMRRGYAGAESASDVMAGMEKEGGGAGGGGAEETGSGSAERFELDIKKNAEEITRLINSEYIKMMPGSADVLKLMKDFNDDTAELNEFLKKDKSEFLSYKINKRIEQVSKDLGEIEKKVSDVAEKMPNTSMNPLRDLWNRSQFLSLDDIFQVGVDIKEWWTRRHTRRKADHAARIGSALFDKIPLPIASEFGTEASARFRKAEEAEVEEWKSRLAHLDAWELTDIIKNLSEEIDPNKDTFKAVIRILADKGRINWRDENLWKLLNKLQNGTELRPGDRSLLKNPILLRQKLHKAFGEIFENYDEYLNLERTTGSNYKSGKEKYIPGFDKIQDQLTGRLEMLLRKHRNGENVDPQEYEGIIEYCIKKGKSTAEDCYFHLMAGVASGLLYADRPLALDGEYINNWPGLQWIYNQKTPLTRKDYIWYCEHFFKKEYENGVMGKDFKTFFWTEVNNDTMVVQRVRKAVSERAWDHDWCRSFAPLGDANTAKRFLAGKSGQQEVKDTAVENAYVGALQWFEENARNPHKIEARKAFARQIAWVAMIDGIVDGVAYERGANDISTRGNASIMNAVPREARVGNHAQWTTKEHKDKIRDFIAKFDPHFFELIRDEVRAKTKEGKEALGKEVRDYLLSQPRYASIHEQITSIAEIDHVFEKLDAIIICMINTVPEEELYRIIDTVKPPKVEE